ncbi:MAG: hypothetical protein HC902_04085 [Calothrix sp. SM1_5_4]|nr:hypothetical protein [Calothrix sp. SM1_5_4]
MSQSRVDFHDFHWLDIGDPAPEILHDLAKTYELHPTSVQDCLQPEHLPKFEEINEVGFIVLRTFDPDSGKDADTVQELTRKSGHLLFRPLSVDHSSQRSGDFISSDSEVESAPYRCDPYA